jgi:nitrate reductase gamma subunit
MILFVGHLVAFAVPRTLLAFNSHPVRLLIIEFSAFIFALIVLAGLALLFIRRVTHPRVKVVTTRMDLVVEVLLLVQVIIGIAMALTMRWGSSWFAAVLTPYLRSVLTFQPDISAVVPLPWLVQLHLVLAYVLLALVPFSRLVHALVLPLHYIWRPYQKVVWNWNHERVRDPDSEWSAKRPTNT